MDKLNIDFLQKELIRITDFIKTSDAKSAFAAAFYSLILKMWLDKMDILSTRLNFSNLVFYLLSLGIFITGIYFLVATVIPRIRNQYTSKSLFYFKHIAQMKFADFQDFYLKLDEITAKKQLAEQIYTSSIIATNKMKHIQKSFVMLFISILLTAIMYIVY